MKILAIIVFTFISNTFAYLTEQVSNFVPQQEKSLTKSSNAQTSSIDKINNIDINMRDIIIAVDTRQITENKNTNDNNNKRSKRHKRRGGRRKRNNHSSQNQQYHNEYQEDDYYNEDDSIVNQYNLDNKYY